MQCFDLASMLDTEFGLFRLFLDFILIGGEPNVKGVVAGRADKEPPYNTGFTLEHGVKAVAIAAGRAGPELVVKVCFYDFGMHWLGSLKV